MSEQVAFGAPGRTPSWTDSTKEGLGTAYHTSCRVWFTLSQGIINELYYPHVDQPNTRDLQLLLTDGETFCHEEKRDLLHEISYPEPNSLFYELTNSDPAGRYRVVKHVLTDPHASVFLQRTRIEVFDEGLRGKLRAFALLAPHLRREGYHNTAYWCALGGRCLLTAHREHVHLCFGCEPDFLRRSVGYVGSSDGWRDLMENFKMDWEFHLAPDGNVALLGEVDLSRGLEFTLGVGFGRSRQSSGSRLLQSFAHPFEEHRRKYVEQWRRTLHEADSLNPHTGDGGKLFRVSRCVLMAHEDKSFSGAMIASMSIPWGETRGDDDLGGYHLVWTRDLVNTATALLAAGQTHTPLQSLIWLACVQGNDGALPQNSWIDGQEFWKGIQLDEVAAPILLAWRLRREDALAGFDPWGLVSRAAAYLIRNGPVTQQERWEEASGYSPSTLAVMIAALVCAAEFAQARGEDVTAKFFLEYADWLSAHVEAWTVTSRGELVPGKPRHYVRITPAQPDLPDPHPDPDTAFVTLANSAGTWPARNVVSTDFLSLVRLGIRDPDDPVILDSVDVIDQVLKYELPQGPCWRRYNHDGYGQKDDGSAWDGTGVGRCWPLLTGERGHYEMTAGRDPLPYLIAMENFANAGGMLSEQVWDGAPLSGFKPGLPTGAAMPLCWAHAEYIELVCGRRNGCCFSRINSVHQRYVVEKKRKTELEIWTPRHPTQRVHAGKRLRFIFAEPAVIRLTTDDWKTTQQIETRQVGDGIWFADLSPDVAGEGACLIFTFYWPMREEWEKANHQVTVME